MTIDVNNLGVIKNASVDTSKPLIIMCGPNSTGKTYLSYILNSIFSNPYRIILDCYERIATSIAETGEFTLKKEDLDEFLIREAAMIKKSVNSIFGISSASNEGLFKTLKINLSISDRTYQTIVRNSLFAHMQFKDVLIKISKHSHTEQIKIEIESERDRIEFFKLPMRDFIIYMVLRLCAHYPVGKSRMLTVERNSIYTFNTELSISRNELIDKILDMQNENHNAESGIINILNSESQRYPYAVRESLKVANDLENIQKGKSYYYNFAEQIEKDLLKGNIGVSKTGNVEFTPESTAKTEKKLPVQVSSSIVKTLSSLIIYLKHLARKNDLLIIDEPEMNLHPDNQRILAHIFARLVNAGLRLVISTHSDYIIREFNNLVMTYALASKNNKDSGKKSIYSKTDGLRPEYIEVLFFHPGSRGKVTVEELPVDEFGFSAPSIDHAIDTQNEVTETLFDRLRYPDE